MTLGERIKSYRHDAGLTLQQLSQQLGISMTYLNDLELGVRTPRRGLSDQTLSRFAGLFQMSVKELRNDIAEPRVLQISAAWTGKEVRVACLSTDGKITIAYPEREEV
jgi:transcriptional regulator with XRE-family HTH domain